jgi:hypothetical protein
MIFFFGIGIFAESKKETKIEQDEPTIAEDLIRKKDLDIGFRLGFGYKPEDRFESDLRNFSVDSSFFSQRQVGSFRNSTNQEFFGRIKVFQNSKIGFVFGGSNFEKFKFTETSLGSITELNFKIRADFMFLTYHFIFPFNRFFLEAGLGMGVNTISWSTSGRSYVRGLGYSRQNGFMVGNGLGYRVDFSFNKKIFNQVVFQIGLFYNYYTVPSFNGSLNDSQSSFYFNNGSVTGISNNQAGQTSTQDSRGNLDQISQILLQERFENDQASRKLDMRMGNLILNFGLSLQFSL